MAPPVRMPLNPEGANGTQLDLCTRLPPTMRNSAMAPILMATIVLLARADSRTPRTSSQLKIITTRKAGTLKYEPVHLPAAYTGELHRSGSTRPNCASCALRYPEKLTQTATLLTAYSRMRSHPMIHAKISPSVA